MTFEPKFMIVLAAFLLFSDSAQLLANKDRLRTVDEMQISSLVVLDGTVTKVERIQSVETPVTDQRPLIREKFRASFLINAQIKGSAIVGPSTKEIVLRYWIVNDERYRGDVKPLLKVGDKFRLYADKVEKADDASLEVAILTSNAIRPEAFGKPVNSSEVQSLQNNSPIVQPPALNEAAESKTIAPKTSSPSEEPTSSMPWSIIVVLIVAALGLLWLLLKRRS